MGQVKMLVYYNRDRPKGLFFIPTLSTFLTPKIISKANLFNIIFINDKYS